MYGMQCGAVSTQPSHPFTPRPHPSPSLRPSMRPSTMYSKCSSPESCMLSFWLL